MFIDCLKTNVTIGACRLQIPSTHDMKCYLDRTVLRGLCPLRDTSTVGMQCPFGWEAFALDFGRLVIQTGSDYLKYFIFLFFILPVSQNAMLGDIPKLSCLYVPPNTFVAILV